MNVLSNTVLEVSGFEVPVALCKGTDDIDVEFDRASLDGHPIRRIEVDSVTGEELTDSEIIRGVRGGDGFVPIDPYDFEEIDLETKLGAISVEGFVPLKEVDLTRARSLYYLLPQRSEIGKNSLRLILNGLARKKVAAVGKLTLRSRQHAFVLQAKDGALVLNLIYTRAELRDRQLAAEALEGAPVRKGAIDLFGKLIEERLGECAIDSLEDDAIPLRAQLKERALAESPVRHSPSVAPADLGRELERKLEESLERLQSQRG